MEIQVVQGSSNSAIGGAFYGQNINNFSGFNSLFIENGATQHGAGLALDIVTTMNLTNNNFISSQNSSALWLNNATGNAINNVFYNNSTQGADAPSSVAFLQ